ncbi:hypothetical protein HMI54_004870 [Coelomomyces lativittatus]|nr:hypothetical protein HMI55_001643 [Coelomomyces lativittatus]KAJ1506694.1 hypothetical protein HMI54_004870 [Coelomomyces lativittatus]KAJ1506784.1 hypothetical protein HMI56_000439 [Coelomomyces lativittatus]
MHQLGPQCFSKLLFSRTYFVLHEPRSWQLGDNVLQKLKGHLRLQKYSSVGPPHHHEQDITTKLTKAFTPTYVSVNDISGGCGSMYRIELISHRFRGLTKVQQQRLVNTVLKDEIQQWHGLQLLTEVPEEDASPK